VYVSNAASSFARDLCLPALSIGPTGRRSGPSVAWTFAQYVPRYSTTVLFMVAGRFFLSWQQISSSVRRRRIAPAFCLLTRLSGAESGGIRAQMFTSHPTQSIWIGTLSVHRLLSLSINSDQCPRACTAVVCNRISRLPALPPKSVQTLRHFSLCCVVHVR